MDKKLDYSKLNKLINIVSYIVKLLLGLMIVGLIYLLIILIKELKICSILLNILNLLSPLFIGFAVAWLFNPLVNYLETKKINRTFGTIISYLIITIIIYLFFKLFIPILIIQANELIKYLPNIINYISGLTLKILKHLNHLVNINISSLRNNILNYVTGLCMKIISNLPNLSLNFVKNIFSTTTNIILGLTIGFYFLIRFDKVKKYLNNLIPQKHFQEISTLIYKLNSLLRYFVSGTLLITLILFVMQSVSFICIRLPSPIFFGILCAFTNLIPYIGPYIGGLPAALVGFSISSTTGILVIITIFICQSIESYILHPLIMSKTMNISAISVICGMIIFGYYFGIWGIILSTPIVAGIKILLLYIFKKFGIINMKLICGCVEKEK